VTPRFIPIPKARPSAGLFRFNPKPTIIMAIKLLATYSKKVGLPGFSSHQFSVSVETELVTTDDVAGESERLYQRLQATVDGQIIHTGFVPPKDYGFEPPADSANGQVSANSPREPAWKCTAKQRNLILEIVEEQQLDKGAVETLAVERFGKGVRQLNKVEASGLIDELLETHGGSDPQGGGRDSSAYQGADGRRAA
jgi:hypothetical protein